MAERLGDRLKTALVIYTATFILGSVLSLMAWSIDFAIGTPLLVGSLICVVAGVFDWSPSVEEPNASEERV